jgi:hypothetical protein
MAFTTGALVASTQSNKTLCRTRVDQSDSILGDFAPVSFNLIYLCLALGKIPVDANHSQNGAISLLLLQP